MSWEGEKEFREKLIKNQFRLSHEVFSRKIFFIKFSTEFQEGINASLQLFDENKKLILCLLGLLDFG